MSNSVNTQHAQETIHSLQLTHIKRHQDNNHKYDSLTLVAQLNVDTNQLAGDYPLHIPLNLIIIPIITGTTAQVNFNTGTITSQIQQSICHKTQNPMIEKYIWGNIPGQHLNSTPFTGQPTSKLSIPSAVPHQIYPQVPPNL